MQDVTMYGRYPDDMTVSAEPVDSAPAFIFRLRAQIFGSNVACLISFNTHRILGRVLLLFPTVNIIYNGNLAKIL